MAKKNRYEYFRGRSDIGKLETRGKDAAVSNGHEVEVVRDDDMSVGIHCIVCDEWACAEIVDEKNVVFGKDEMHGTLFEYKCGQHPVYESAGEMAWDRIADIFGGLNEPDTV
jgi:hypothetical protein